MTKNPEDPYSVNLFAPTTGHLSIWEPTCTPSSQNASCHHHHHVIIITIIIISSDFQNCIIHRHHHHLQCHVKGRKLDQRDVSAPIRWDRPHPLSPLFVTKLRLYLSTSKLVQNLSSNDIISLHCTVITLSILSIPSQCKIETWGKISPSFVSGCGKCCPPRQARAQVQGWRHQLDHPRVCQLLLLLPALLSSSPKDLSVEKMLVRHFRPRSGTSALSRPAKLMLRTD